MLGVSLSGCHSGGDAGSRVLSVSVEPQRYLLERIAGDRWQVNTVLSKGADPENYDPTMSTLVKTASSKIYFTIGMGGFETELAERLSDAAPGIEFIDASEGIERIYGTHDCHHGHEAGYDGHEYGEADPHIWTSPANMKKMAENMAEELCRMDPDGADVYRANLMKLECSIDSVDAKVREILSGNGSRAFMVGHPSLSYFAHDYDLTQIALGGDGKELSASALRGGIDRGRDEGAYVFFMEPQGASGREAQIIKALAGMGVMLNTMDYEWPRMMELVAESIARTPRKRADDK